MSFRVNYQNDPLWSSRKRKRKININEKLDTPTKSCLKEIMKGSWYERNGWLSERSSENVTSSASYSQRKLIDWQTKNESSGDEDSDSESQWGKFANIWLDDKYKTFE